MLFNSIEEHLKTYRDKYNNGFIFDKSIYNFSKMQKLKKYFSKLILMFINYADKNKGNITKQGLLNLLESVK